MKAISVGAIVRHSELRVMEEALAVAIEDIDICIDSNSVPEGSERLYTSAEAKQIKHWESQRGRFKVLLNTVRRTRAKGRDA